MIREAHSLIEVRTDLFRVANDFFALLVHLLALYKDYHTHNVPLSSSKSLVGSRGCFLSGLPSSEMKRAVLSFLIFLFFMSFSQGSSILHPQRELGTNQFTRCTFLLRFPSVLSSVSCQLGLPGLSNRDRWPLIPDQLICVRYGMAVIHRAELRPVLVSRFTYRCVLGYIEPCHKRSFWSSNASHEWR